MTTVRAVVLIAAASLLSAAMLAWVSRAPAQVRERTVPEQAYAPDLGARFPAEDVARHGAYRGPSYLHFALSLSLSIVVLAALALGPWPRAVARFEAVP